MSEQMTSLPLKMSWSSGTVATIDGAAVGVAVGAAVGTGAPVGVGVVAVPQALASSPTTTRTSANRERRTMPKPPPAWVKWPRCHTDDTPSEDMADHDYFQFVTPDWDVITATHRVL